MPASFDILRDEKTLWKDMFKISRDDMLPVIELDPRSD
jgi:hypothetical protein